MQCANSYFLTQYESQQAQADERAEWIETQAKVKFAEMMPIEQDPIGEALTEVMFDNGKAAPIIAAFNGQSDEDLGKLIRAAVVDYWTDYCRNQAADEYDDGEQS